MSSGRLRGATSVERRHRAGFRVGTVPRAAFAPGRLGISRPALIDRLCKHGLKP